MKKKKIYAVIISAGFVVLGVQGVSVYASELDEYETNISNAEYDFNTLLSAENELNQGISSANSAVSHNEGNLTDFINNIDYMTDTYLNSGSNFTHLYAGWVNDENCNLTDYEFNKMDNAINAIQDFDEETYGTEISELGMFNDFYDAKSDFQTILDATNQYKVDRDETTYITATQGITPKGNWDCDYMLSVYDSAIDLATQDGSDKALAFIEATKSHQDVVRGYQSIDLAKMYEDAFKMKDNIDQIYFLNNTLTEVKKNKEEKEQELSNLKTEYEAKKAEEEAKQKAEEEAKLKAEEEAKKKAEEEAKLKAEEEAKQKSPNTGAMATSGYSTMMALTALASYGLYKALKKNH